MIKHVSAFALDCVWFLYRKEIEQLCNLSLVETWCKCTHERRKGAVNAGKPTCPPKKKESNSFSSVAVALRNKFHHRVSCFMHRVSNFELVSQNQSRLLLLQRSQWHPLTSGQMQKLHFNWLCLYQRTINNSHRLAKFVPLSFVLLPKKHFFNLHLLTLLLLFLVG